MYTVRRRALTIALAAICGACSSSNETTAALDASVQDAASPDATVPADSSTATLDSGVGRYGATAPDAASASDGSAPVDDDDDDDAAAAGDSGDAAEDVGVLADGATCVGPGGNVGPLAATPPMGWNSWNTFQGRISDTLVRQTADAMVASGMADAGYAYVVIDDTWASSRGADGNIVPDASRFPDMKALADYVHCKGLKFGIYSDRGTQTCAGRPGSLGFETQDATTYASWGVDYVKYDNCNAAQGTIEEDYEAMGSALVATGRPIVYSLSAWWYYDWEPAVGNLWRTTTDITDTWESVAALIDRNGGSVSRYGSCTSCPDASGGSCVVCNAAVPEAAFDPSVAPAAGPGHWNDPDMLEVGNGGMTDTEYRSHFSMWAMMAAPLIAGNDLRTMTAETTAILTNGDVIAVDQDPLGAQGVPVSASTTLEVWSKPLSGTSTYAVALFNRTAAAADITVTFSGLGIASGNASAVRDLWAHSDLGAQTGQYTAAAVPSHGVVLLKVVGQ